MTLRVVAGQGNAELYTAVRGIHHRIPLAALRS